MYEHLKLTKCVVDGDEITMLLAETCSLGVKFPIQLSVVLYHSFDQPVGIWYLLHMTMMHYCAASSDPSLFYYTKGKGSPKGKEGQGFRTPHPL